MPKEREIKASGEIHPRNVLNDLPASEWIRETVSVWRQRGLGANHPDAVIEKLHPAPFSFTDVARLIRFFTKSGHTVLDPFVGIGSTLKAAAVEGRKGLGIELNPQFVELARERLSSELDGNLLAERDQKVLEGDVRDLLPTIAESSVDLVITSPPYWNILHKEDHKARQERSSKGLATRYSDDERDFGNIGEYDVFLRELTEIFSGCARPLRPGRYMALVVGDFRDKGSYRMFHADLARSLEEASSFVLKGITILHQPQKRVFPYGYPAAYVPNLHHQYILILRNEKS